MLNITETESSSSESVSDEDKEYVPQKSEESDGSSDEEPLKVPVSYFKCVRTLNVLPAEVTLWRSALVVC